MKLLKTLLCLLLALTMALNLCACKTNPDNSDPGKSPGQSDPDKKKELPPMTTEEITLNYASWEDPVIAKALADAFMEKYPNIKVNLINISVSNNELISMAGAGKLPDAFWFYANCDVPLSNQWLLDMTEYFENDPENDNLLDTIKKVGYYIKGKKLAAACTYLPFTIFVNKTLYERRNVPMPDTHWTWSEMIQNIRKMTILEEGIYGYGDLTNMVTMYPIVQYDCDGEFGWDGEKFDLTQGWADALEQNISLIRAGCCAPYRNTPEAAEAFGSADIWAPTTGRVAIQLDMWFTLTNFDMEEFKNKGIEYVPYVVPRGDNAKTNHKPAAIDFGGISSGTKHPREAYELLKFMNWGREGWLVKLKAYKKSIEESTTPYVVYPNKLPLIKDKDIWDGLKELLPRNKYVDAFLEQALEPIPMGGAAIPGFQSFIDEVYLNYNGEDVSAACKEGKYNPHDVAPELTQKLNQYYQDALATFEDLYM